MYVLKQFVTINRHYTVIMYKRIHTYTTELGPNRQF